MMSHSRHILLTLVAFVAIVSELHAFFVFSKHRGRNRDGFAQSTFDRTSYRRPSTIFAPGRTGTSAYGGPSKLERLQKIAGNSSSPSTSPVPSDTADSTNRTSPADTGTQAAPHAPTTDEFSSPTSESPSQEGGKTAETAGTPEDTTTGSTTTTEEFSSAPPPLDSPSQDGGKMAETAGTPKETSTISSTPTGINDKNNTTDPNSVQGGDSNSQDSPSPPGQDTQQESPSSTTQSPQTSGNAPRQEDSTPATETPSPTEDSTSSPPSATQVGGNASVTNTTMDAKQPKNIVSGTSAMGGWHPTLGYPPQSNFPSAGGPGALNYGREPFPALAAQSGLPYFVLPLGGGGVLAGQQPQQLHYPPPVLAPNAVGVTTSPFGNHHDPPGTPATRSVASRGGKKKKKAAYYHYRGSSHRRDRDRLDQKRGIELITNHRPHSRQSRYPTLSRKKYHYGVSSGKKQVLREKIHLLRKVRKAVKKAQRNPLLPTPTIVDKVKLERVQEELRRLKLEYRQHKQRKPLRLLDTPLRRDGGK